MTDDGLLDDVNRFCEELRPLEDVAYLEHAYNEETIPLAKEHDLMGMTVPEQYGGRGADTETYVKALERIGREGSGIRTIFSVHTSLVQWILTRFGSTEQKEAYLPGTAAGDVIGAFALTEPEAGSDPRAMEATYREDGDDYVLNGTKYLISNAGIAGIIIVFAEDPDGMIAAFIVETDREGFKEEELVSKMGTPTTDTAMFELDDCRVPEDRMIGGPEDGWRIAKEALIHGRLGVAAGCVGSMQDCLDAAVEYAREREQHGKKIGKHQLVQEHIAMMKTRLEAGREMVRRATEAVEAWEEDVEDGELQDAADQAVAEAKLFCANASWNVADRGVQIFGGKGWSFLYRPGRHLVDNRVTRIYEGSDEIMKLKIAAGVLGEDYAAFR